MWSQILKGNYSVQEFIEGLYNNYQSGSLGKVVADIVDVMQYYIKFLTILVSAL